MSSLVASQSVCPRLGGAQRAHPAPGRMGAAPLAALRRGGVRPRSFNAGRGGALIVYAGRDLYEGLDGRDVRELQDLLSKSGLLDYSNRTGYYGPATTDAVKRWQAQHQLPSTGYWGPASQQAAKLERSVRPQMPTKSVQPRVVLDDPYGVSNNQPSALVPWNRVPFSDGQHVSVPPRVTPTFQTSAASASPPSLPLPLPSGASTAVLGAAVALSMVGGLAFAVNALAGPKKKRSVRVARPQAQPWPGYDADYRAGSAGAPPAQAPRGYGGYGGMPRGGEGGGGGARLPLGGNLGQTGGHAGAWGGQRAAGYSQYAYEDEQHNLDGGFNAFGGYGQQSRHNNDHNTRMLGVDLTQPGSTAAVGLLDTLTAQHAAAPSTQHRRHALRTNLTTMRATLQHQADVYQQGTAAYARQVSKLATDKRNIGTGAGAGLASREHQLASENSALSAKVQSLEQQLESLPGLVEGLSRLEHKLAGATLPPVPTRPAGAPPATGGGPGAGGAAAGDSLRAMEAALAALQSAGEVGSEAQVAAAVNELQGRLAALAAPLVADAEAARVSTAQLEALYAQTEAVQAALAAAPWEPALAGHEARLVALATQLTEVQEAMVQVATEQGRMSQLGSALATPAPAAGEGTSEEAVQELYQRVALVEEMLRGQPNLWESLTLMKSQLDSVVGDAVSLNRAATESGGKTAGLPSSRADLWGSFGNLVNSALSLPQALPGVMGAPPGPPPELEAGIQSQSALRRDMEALAAELAEVKAAAARPTLMDEVEARLSAFLGTLAAEGVVDAGTLEQLQAADAAAAPLAARLAAVEAAVASQAAAAPTAANPAFAAQVAALETTLHDLAAVVHGSGAVAGTGASADASPEVLARLEALENTVAALAAGAGGDGGELVKRVSRLEAAQQEAAELNLGIMQQMAALEEAINEVNMAEAMNARLSAMEAAIVELHQQTSTKDAVDELFAKVAHLEAALALPAAPPAIAVPDFAPPPPPPADAPLAPEPAAAPEAPAAPAAPPLREWEPLWRVKEGRELFLQGFHWDSCKHDWYTIVESKLDAIAAAGFTGIWLPPPSDSLAPQGYLPRNLYLLDTKYGSADQLRQLVRAIHDRGMHAMADIVINHRCATVQGAGGQWNKWEGTGMDWGEWAVCSGSFAGQGAPQSGMDFHAAPNIDHTNKKVREDICTWLRWLREDVGFDTFRFDFSKGYGGEFVKTYLEAAQPEFSVGEFWDTMAYGNGLEYNQDHHRQQTIDWIDRTGGQSTAFDFTTKGILQEACRNNEFWRLADTQKKPPGLLGRWPSHAVTFIDNHDTGSTQAHWPFPGDKVLLGYAYVLTHPGNPFVMWDHFFDWGSENTDTIRTMMAIRVEAGVHSRSKIQICAATDSVYSAIVQGDNAQVAMKIGPGNWSPGDGWNMAKAGKDFAIWTK